MNGRDVITTALAKGVVLDMKHDGRLVARGDPKAIEEIRPIVNAHRTAVMAALRGSGYSSAELAEFDHLIDHLVALWQFPEERRQAMRETRRRMAPCRAREELEALREQVAEAEALRETLVREMVPC